MSRTQLCSAGFDVFRWVQLDPLQPTGDVPHRWKIRGRGQIALTQRVGAGIQTLRAQSLKPIWLRMRQRCLPLWAGVCAVAAESRRHKRISTALASTGGAEKGNCSRGPHALIARYTIWPCGKKSSLGRAQCYFLLDAREIGFPFAPTCPVPCSTLSKISTLRDFPPQPDWPRIANLRHRLVLLRCR